MTIMAKTRECPFPDCEWSHEYDETSETARMSADHKSEMHYERKHAGRVRVQMTWEMEHLLGGLSAQEHRDRLMEKYDGERRFGGYELAHVRTEVIEQADDHGTLSNHE